MLNGDGLASAKSDGREGLKQPERRMFSYGPGYRNLHNEPFQRGTVEKRKEVPAGRRKARWWFKDMGVLSRQPKTGFSNVERSR